MGIACMGSLSFAAKHLPGHRSDIIIECLGLLVTERMWEIPLNLLNQITASIVADISVVDGIGMCLMADALVFSSL